MKKMKKIVLLVIICSLLFSFEVSASGRMKAVGSPSNRAELQMSQNVAREFEKQAQPENQQLLPPPKMNGERNPSSVQPQIDYGMQQELQGQDQSIVPEEDYIEILGNVTQEQYDNFDVYLDMVDANLLQSFINKGWEIILTDADLDDLLFQGTTEGVMGCTYFSNKTIYIAVGDYSYCIIHEMGHYLDYYYDFASDTEEFETIFESEAVNLSEYGQTSSEEFLAEIYMYAIMEPESTIQACPMATEYVDELVENVA